MAAPRDALFEAMKKKDLCKSEAQVVDVFATLADASLEMILAETVAVVYGEVATKSILFMPCGWVVAVKTGDNDVFGTSTVLLPKADGAAERQKDVFSFLKSQLKDSHTAMQGLYAAVLKQFSP